MNQKSSTMNSHPALNALTGWFFGLLFIAIGLINTFWGNDTYYGLFIVILSLIFLPPVSSLVKSWFGISLPAWVKIVLALFILWTALGVGELPAKIELMKQDLWK